VIVGDGVTQDVAAGAAPAVVRISGSGSSSPLASRVAAAPVLPAGPAAPAAPVRQADASGAVAVVLLLAVLTVIGLRLIGARRTQPRVRLEG
jgi:hypothetical protein